jgi:alkanesulfonate monooxygenase SsuD/methylene tetrahydromethanopterin reductase-like flavin-dependent oxidoreductase (luciferase family)
VRLCLSIEIQEGLSYDETLALTRAAEGLDFEASLLAEHYYPTGVTDRYAGGLGSRMAADAWLFLAGLARQTTRIRLGTLVTPVTFRHPSVLAKMAATLDHMSAGRAELGIGAGWFPVEHAAYGFEFPGPKERVDLVEEQLQIINGLFSQDPFSHSGTHYRLDEAHFTPRPVQQPRPTIIVGGSANAQRLSRLAARYADEYVITLPSIEQCQAIRDRLDQACERVGRDPSEVRLSVFTPLCVADTEQDVKDTYATLRETNPQYLRMMNAETAWIMGTPEQAGEQLQRLEHAGIARVLLSVNCDLHLRMLPLLAVNAVNAPPGTPVRPG